MYRPPETGRGIQGAIRQLCDETGVASIAREIGFIDEAGEIGELRQYDEQATRARANVPSRKRKEPDSDDSDDMERSSKKRKTAGLAAKEKGLRLFSSKVCEKVEAKRSTTYNEVADELVAEFSEDTTGGLVDSKNIRRRVYDALNVLMAMNIIQKDKKEIKWKGLPTQEVKKEYVALQEDKEQCEERVRRKREQLEELAMQQLLYKNIIARNSREKAIENNERIYLPFIVIHTKKDTKIDCEMSKDRDRYFFEFSQPFTIHDDCEILKRMGLNDPHYEQKLGGGPPTTNFMPGMLNTTGMPLPGGLTGIGLGNPIAGLGMGLGGLGGFGGLGMMGLGPRMTPLGAAGIAGTNVPGALMPGAGVTLPSGQLPLSQLEQLQLQAQLQQANLRNQLLQKQYEDHNRQKLLQQQLQLQYQLQHWQEQHRQQLPQPPPVQVKPEPESNFPRSPSSPPPPTIRSNTNTNTSTNPNPNAPTNTTSAQIK